MRTGGPEVALMSVRVEGEETWSAGRPTILFEGPYFYSDTPGAIGEVRTYDVSQDGQFLMMKDFSTNEGGEVQRSRITVVLNWFQELTERVPVN